MSATIVIEWCAAHEPATVTLTGHRAVRLAGWVITNRIVFPMGARAHEGRTANTSES